MREMSEVRLDPAFATNQDYHEDRPGLVLRISGGGRPPRTVASGIWPRLPWAGLNLTTGDLCCTRSYPIAQQCGEHRRLPQAGKPVASWRARFRGSNYCGFKPRYPSWLYKAENTSEPLPLSY